LTYNDIPKEIKESTHSDKQTYKSMLKNRAFIQLTRSDLFRNVVRDYRIKDFISRDPLYASTINSGSVYYTTLDKKVVKKFLQLLDELEAQGYNAEAIKLRSGHRHPKQNYYLGGASQSRHICGEAIDIGVGDINADGKSNDQDKKIVLDILETKIIKNGGGIGSCILEQEPYILIHAVIVHGGTPILPLLEKNRKTKSIRFRQR
jgi:hypothetical protein